MKKIKIADEFINYVERIKYEKDSRKDTIEYMLINNIVNPRMFNKVNQEYHEFFLEFELVKRWIEKFYIDEQCERFKSWNIDFKDKEVTFYD